ncbi:serine protease [Lentzea sp. NBRC 105346]|uniref:S1 family peptidase n=1 Tax=Lentzea sp. NBRC 105346 TaxID=3032205 RepID=UPI0024A1F926|nr:S1 family peptidase [Lentzea sp. NBRC 105346]GLZ35054.1 serine protease [Lentzea sp. NBRC 105346]
MKPKVITALLAALTTLSFAVPAHAAEPKARIVSPALAEAMRRDLGLTPAQVTLRLAQEAKAAKTEQTARAALGDHFGGAWFDSTTGRLVVQSTKAVELPGAEVRTVARSERALTEIKNRVDRIDNAPEGSWNVDVRANAVVLRITNNAPGAEAFIAKAKEIDPAIQVQRTPPKPRPLAEVMGALPYYVNNSWRCSIGFAVEGGFVTAGHCGSPGDHATNHDGEDLGNVERSIFPTRDMGFVRTVDGVTLQPLVYGYDGYAYYVYGSQEAPIGASICRSGSTSGMHCGYVESKDDTINYAEGTVYHMTGTSVCAEGGDSGGSWLSGNEAQGVTSGGYGDCSGGGKTWFQPVNPILDEFGLSLITA